MEIRRPREGAQALDASRAAAVGTSQARYPSGNERASTRHDKRSCGSCAACCGGWLHLVVGQRIVDGASCPHSTGHSCGIYGDRPFTCRDFACAWLKPGSVLPSGYRPDKVGVIVLDHRLTWRGLPVDVLVVAGTAKDRFLSWYNNYARTHQRLFLLQQGGLCSAFGPVAFLAEISARLERGERLY
jgi:hypothetical protein